MTRLTLRLRRAIDNDCAEALSGAMVVVEVPLPSSVGVEFSVVLPSVGIDVECNCSLRNCSLPLVFVS